MWLDDFINIPENPILIAALCSCKWTKQFDAAAQCLQICLSNTHIIIAFFSPATVPDTAAIETFPFFLRPYVSLLSSLLSYTMSTWALAELIKLWDFSHRQGDAYLRSLALNYSL